jgi:FAD/FMN-containing dehydrogenase
MRGSPLAAMEGAVIRPGDDRYDQARGIYNRLLDARPALIARPAGVADVARALELSRQEGYEVAVRSGGHSIAGHGTTDGVLGGAVARVPATATAFAHRRRRLVCSVVAAGFDPSRADHHRAWVRSVADRLAPLSKGAYLNFVGVGDEDQLDEVYPPATLRRLAAVKARYDPGNLFRRNLNIRP